MTASLENNTHRITGNVRVEQRAKGRVWVAAYVKADGAKTRRTLGSAWVKDSGRRTPRNAPIWHERSLVVLVNSTALDQPRDPQVRFARSQFPSLT